MSKMIVSMIHISHTYYHISHANPLHSSVKYTNHSKSTYSIIYLHSRFQPIALQFVPSCTTLRVWTHRCELIL